MSRLQIVSEYPDTRALPALIAASNSTKDENRREPLVLPFTKAELRQIILEIMG